MKKRTKIILIIVAVLIVTRLVLDVVVLRFLNKELAAMDGYYGHVDDIDLNLYRGAYIVDSIYINKVDSVNNKQTPFMAAKKIDLSVEWASLFRGRVVGELEFVEPSLMFTREKTELATVQKDTADFRDILNTFMPLQINRFDITRGQIIYIDSTTTPKVNVRMDNVYVTALNLKSVRDTATLPARVTASANVYEGTMQLKMKMDPLSDQPLFDMNVSMENTYLPDLNPFFKAYGNMDVNKGTFGMYTELATKEGKFKGYVKPVIKDLDVKGPEDRDDEFLNKVWENIVTLFGKILENPKADQVATKIPLEGSFEDVKAGTWNAVVELLRNAFVKALYPSIDNQINIASVKTGEEKKEGFIKKLFSKEEKEREQKDQKKDD